MTYTGTKFGAHPGSGGNLTTIVFGADSSGWPLSNVVAGARSLTVGATLDNWTSALGTAGAYTPTNFAASTPAGGISEKNKSPDQIAFENRKARLIALVIGMKKSSPNWNAVITGVNDLSARSAQKFLECLPGNALLPRVAPDGEGDIMFVWDGSINPSCVVTVEKNTLHLVSNMGTPEAKQIDSKKFLGVQIPAAILEHIPFK